MGLYDSTNPEVKTFRGLHLYHFAFSNCSQRVRIVLEEKSLPWTSHHLDLASNEHATPEYRTINPNGVVPTLVHDGRVYIESNDIIAYLDEAFPDPPLVQSSADARQAVARHLRAAEAIQASIKVLSHELLFKAFRKISGDDIARIDTALGNRELVAFLRDYAEDGAAWQARVASARTAMEEALDVLEEFLIATPWLSGASFGLADVSWVVNVHRLMQASYPLSSRPNILRWYERMLDRPAFQRAVIDWRPNASA